VQLRHGSLGCTVDTIIDGTGAGPAGAPRNTTQAPPARLEEDDGTQGR
jgi:hypothetical protein